MPIGLVKLILKAVGIEVATINNELSLVFEGLRRRMAGIITMVEFSVYHSGSRGSVESVGKSRGGFGGTSTTAAVMRTSEPIVSYRPTRLMSL